MFVLKSKYEAQFKRALELERKLLRIRSSFNSSRYVFDDFAWEASDIEKKIFKLNQRSVDADKAERALSTLKLKHEKTAKALLEAEQQLSDYHDADRLAKQAEDQAVIEKVLKVGDRFSYASKDYWCAFIAPDQYGVMTIETAGQKGEFLNGAQWFSVKDLPLIKVIETK